MATIRLAQILRGKKVEPATELEAAVKSAVARSAAELPAVTGSDNGKVLTVTSGAWGAVLPTAELPAVSGSDNGKVLTVTEGAWGAVLPTDKTPLVITGTVDGTTVTITTALATIKTAFDAGRTVFLDAAGIRLAIIRCAEATDEINAAFAATAYDGTQSAVVNYTAVFANALAGTLITTKLATANS